MPPRKQAHAGPRPVESIRHDDKRLNIPTADAQEFLSEEAARPAKLRYPRDPSLDPQLVWEGKDEQDAEDLAVDAPPIFIQEKIDPRAIIDNLRPAPEPTLFDDFDGLEGWQSVEYYQHPANWSNRMVLGDSLQVMASLAEKENLRGQVQMIYIDPPYGIRFGSNWQVSTRSRDVKDGKATDTTREVEQIKAFRDTWEKGIHSYLAYLRDRLVVARDLLTESGSVFVQIGDENVHLVRCLLDEVFGSENFVSLITFKKTSGAGSFAGGTVALPGTSDYLVWYAKEVDQLKYRTVYRQKLDESGQYSWVDHDGRRARASGEVTGDGRKFRPSPLTSETTRVGQTTVFPVEFENRTYRPSRGGWKTNRSGMLRLLTADRILAVGSTLSYVRYIDDFPAVPFTNFWEDTQASGYADPKIFVVQTNTKVVERCLLMTTDPGDLVLDPTCGSGTTAYVAEEWGRRWITVDTSRVALALARQRLMGAQYPYYLLADSPEGRKKEAEVTGQPPANGPTGGDVHKGFVYERVPHITLKSIANNPDIHEGMSRQQIDAAIQRHADTELLYDRPYVDKRKLRVAGRFTVESLSPHRTIAPETETGAERAADTADASNFERTILDNLRKAGVQNGRKAERLEFESLSPYPGTYLQAEGSQKNHADGAPQRIAVSIGPQYGTVSADWIKDAAREAVKGVGFDMLLVCAFAFDPRALETTEEFAPSDPTDFAKVQDERRLGRLPVLLVRMNSDLAMGDALLKKTGSGNLFMVFGEPDVAIDRTGNDLVVEIRGVDVYNPTTGEIRSSGTDDIAMWMIDTEYNEESFFVRHCYFLGSNDPYTRLKKTLRNEINEDAWATLYSARSRPFPVPERRKIAVKVIDHYGNEVLQGYEV